MEAGPVSGAVVGRFAPSPSGRLHLGNLACSLLAWLSAKSQGGRIVLRIPNEEIASSMHEGYMAYCLRDKAEDFAGVAADTAYEIAEKGITHVGAALRAAFAMIPYEWICKDEAEAKRYFLLFCKFMKADISGERQSARGRADAVLKTPAAVYVFEFKLGAGGRDGARPSPGGPSSVSAAAALAQIKAKGYAEKWLRCGKKVTLIGAAFDADMRNLSDRQVEVAADA